MKVKRRKQLNSFMYKYFFIIGRYPLLSISEIFSFFEKSGIIYKTHVCSEEAVIIITDTVLDPERIMSVLGGTVKFGQIINEVNLSAPENKVDEIFLDKDFVLNYFPQNIKKIKFGLSFYNAGDKLLFEKFTQQAKGYSLKLKEILKNSGRKAGFLMIKDRFLSSVSVFKNGLIDKGTEMVFILGEEIIYIGKTLSVQHFESFSFRDISRPNRDKKSGIMPPKLARMMLNISGVKNDDVMLDPFCGSGTILCEAIILGIKNIYGNDVNRKAIENTRENINWIFSNYKNINKNYFQIHLLENDVRKLDTKINPGTVSVIVTEPYLGPPFLHPPNTDQVLKIIHDLSNLYLESFGAFYRLLKPKGKIIIVFPVFSDNQKNYHLNIYKDIKKIGFRRLSFVSDDILNNKTLIPDANMLYGHKDNFIKREIVLWDKI